MRVWTMYRRSKGSSTISQCWRLSTLINQKNPGKSQAKEKLTKEENPYKQRYLCPHTDSCITVSPQPRATRISARPRDQEHREAGQQTLPALEDNFFNVLAPKDHGLLVRILRLLQDASLDLLISLGGFQKIRGISLLSPPKERRE